MSRPLGDFRRAFVISLTLFVGGMLALTSYTLYRLHTDSIKNGLDIAAMHSRAFEDFLTQSLYISELVAANISHSNSMTTGQPDIERIFRATIEHTPFLRSISLLDEHQRIITSSNSANLGKRVSLADYLPTQRNNEPLLRIGVPWAGRDFANGKPLDTASGTDGNDLYFIPVSLSLSMAHHSFTLLLALNPDHFLNQIAQKISVENGSVKIYRFDGTLLMDSDPAGRPGSGHRDLMQRLGLPDIEIGQSAVGFDQNKNTLAAFKASRLYPFIIFTQLDRDVVLNVWQTEMQTLMSVVISVLFGSVILASRYYRHQNQLVKQQARSERLERINAASVFNNAREGIAIIDANGLIEDINESFTRITQFHRDEALGQNFAEVFLNTKTPYFHTEIQPILLQNGYWSNELWGKRRDGVMYAMMLTLSVVRDDKDQLHQYVALFSDITATKEHEQQLEYAARYDHLTKLPNRVFLSDYIDHAMYQTQRRGQYIAIVFIDLDGFKAINDTYGHIAGDHLLITIAAHLKQALREGDTLARVGGDEFVAVLIDLSEPEIAEPIFERLLLAAAQPVKFDEQHLQVSASLGATYYPQGKNVNLDQLIQQADHAMYQAKQHGKNRWYIADGYH